MDNELCPCDAWFRPHLSWSRHSLPRPLDCVLVTMGLAQGPTGTLKGR